jgi:hypothetical protein
LGNQAKNNLMGMEHMNTNKLATIVMSLATLLFIFPLSAELLAGDSMKTSTAYTATEFPESSELPIEGAATTTTTTTTTPTAFLQSSALFGTGTQIQIFRVPTMDNNGNITYYDLTIPLTVTSKGAIATTAPVKSAVSKILSSNQFVPGTYVDKNGEYGAGKCTVSASVTTGGRNEVAFQCANDPYAWSGAAVTGPIIGNPYQAALQAAGIDKLPGATNFAWGVLGSATNENLWGCGYDGDIISISQVGTTISITDFKTGNKQQCGTTLVKQ